MRDSVLSMAERVFLGAARRAVLATVAADGRPRLVPICFVLDERGPLLYTPLDKKPKSVENPRDLARVRDLLADPRVSVLVDRWDEDWAALAWLRCHGTASLMEPGDDRHASVVIDLRGKYPQYNTHRLEGRPIIRIAIEHTTSWGALGLA